MEGVHQNAKQTATEEFPKRTTVRREARLFWIKMLAEVIDICERDGGHGG